MDLQAEIERIISLRGIRSADRAVLRRMLDQLKHGHHFTGLEREHLWSFLKRYGAA